MSTAHLQRGWASILRELKGNPRLQIGLAAIAVLILAFAWQAVDQMRSHLQKRAIAAEVDLRRVRALQGQTVWFERADATESMLKLLQAQIPEARTSGLAQASLQSWLSGIAANATSGPDPLRISMDSAAEVENLPGILRVKASMSGAISAAQALNVVRQIESSPNLVAIETISIRSDVNSLFNLTLVGHYRIAEGSDAK